jgi:hypothetical protein
VAGWGIGPSARPSVSSTEGVLNGSAVADTQHWSANSAAGLITVVRAVTSSVPVANVRSAVEFRRPQASGPWAYALAGIRSAEVFFRVGRIYRMRMYVRDLNASGLPVELLLGNGQYSHRPTEASVTSRFTDTNWHLLTRTFVATSAAAPDTALYLALPASGVLRWQATAASVQEVSPPAPATMAGPATRVVAFNGPAGTAPDPATWSSEIGSAWGNNELQAYVAGTDNAALNGNGSLVLTARRQSHVAPSGIVREYTSARLSTQNKLDVLPGSYVEAPIRAPVGQGVFPAFWLLGSNLSQVGWPASGELDVLEAVGSEPTLARSAAHMSMQADSRVHAQYGWDDTGGTVDLGHPLDSQVHRYGVYFDDRTVRFYVDRRERMALWAEDALAAGRTWPFGRSHFLVLNIAIGLGDPTNTVFPREMTVGPISIWQGGIPA